jgi:hypothetical protein
VPEEHVASIFRFEEQAKQETSMKQAKFRAGFLLRLLFNPEDGGEIFLRKVG